MSRLRRLAAGRRKARAGAHPPAVLDQPLHVADAGLRGAVVVGVARDAEAGHAIDEGLHERLAPIGVADREQAVAATVFAVHAADAALRALEVGEDVGVAPTGIAGLRPGVEVGGVPAIVDHAVDGTRSPERAALRYIYGAIGGAGAGLRFELPGDARIEQDLDDAARDADHRVRVFRPGFQKADGNGGIVGQAIGQHAARRPRADDHVIELVRVRRSHARVSLSRLRILMVQKPIRPFDKSRLARSTAMHGARSWHLAAIRPTAHPHALALYKNKSFALKMVGCCRQRYD
jgi:hypothetical protein